MAFSADVSGLQGKDRHNMPYMCILSFLNPMLIIEVSSVRGQTINLDGSNTNLKSPHW